MYICSPAQVAKLVDALCSGRSVRKDVLVRIQSWAQSPSIAFVMKGFVIQERDEQARQLV